jgi:hypothetical protein
MPAPKVGASEVIFIELLAVKFSIRGIFSLRMILIGKSIKLHVEHMYLVALLAVSTRQDMNILFHASPDDFNATN